MIEAIDEDERNLIRKQHGRLGRIVGCRFIREHWRVIRGRCRAACGRSYDRRNGRRNLCLTIGLRVVRNQPNQHDQNYYCD